MKYFDRRAPGGPDFENIPVESMLLKTEFGESIPLTLEIEDEGVFELFNEAHDISVRGMCRDSEVGIVHLTIGTLPKKNKIGTRIMDILESALQKRRIHTIWTAFRKHETLQFLRARGYDLVDPNVLEEEHRFYLGFWGVGLQEGVTDSESFERWLVNANGEDSGLKVLMKKEFGELEE